MRPAFSSTRQAAAFAFLLLFLLAAPWLTGKNLLPAREQAYASEGFDWGPYPWIEKQIFEETNAIDIAFMGSSHMLVGVDAPYIQRQLEAMTRHATVVRSICWSGPGFDADYFIIKDLLDHRRVKTLVLYDESDGTVDPMAAHWFRFGDNAETLPGLPLLDQGVYYFAATLGWPRNLLEYFTPNLPADAASLHAGHPEIETRIEATETGLGSMPVRMVFGRDRYAAFTVFSPETGATPADASVYSPANGTNFEFLNRPIQPREAFFARKIALLAEKHGCQLIMLHLPTLAERRSPVVKESAYWPDLFKTQTVMLGIPPARLFAGLSDQDVEKLYYNPYHLNQNGQQYFTPLITPALLALYEKNQAHQ